MRILRSVAVGIAFSSPLLVAALLAQEGAHYDCIIKLSEGGGFDQQCRPLAPSPSPTASPSSEPSPTPLPSPTATATPSPVPTPPGGQVGGGWQTQGGAGCPKGRCGKSYEVTNLNDRGPGSLRAGVEGRSGANGGPINITFAVAGKIRLTTQLQIRAPYVTIDGYTAPAPGITLEDANCDPERMFGILSTHDIKIRGIRFTGDNCWRPGVVERNWELMLSDGDVGPDNVPWDDQPPRECNRKIYIEHSTFIGAMNDAGGFWCCTEGATADSNFYAMSYHPVTTGCKGWRGPTDPEAKHNVSYTRNLYWKNGERAPKVNEGCYDCDVVNNVSGSNQDYSGLDPQGSGPGGNLLNIRDSPNFGLNVIGNALLAGIDHYIRDVDGVIKLVPGAWRPGWDCFWGADPGGPTPDPRRDRQHFSDNFFTAQHNPRHCVSTPGGASMFQRSYLLPILSVRALESIITGAGMPWPDAREQALKAEALAAYRARVGQ